MFLVFCVMFVDLIVFTLCLVCLMMILSLDFPFFISPTIFSKIY